jgi:hypothetical protein
MNSPLTMSGRHVVCSAVWPHSSHSSRAAGSTPDSCRRASRTARHERALAPWSGSYSGESAATGVLASSASSPWRMRTTTSLSGTQR